MGRSLQLRILDATGLALIFAAGARAGVVQNVNAPGLQYAQIQQAIDTASDGDVLLITGGSYQPFTINGKSLTLAAVPGASVTISGTIQVLNVPATGEVDLLGISATASYVSTGTGSHGSPALVLTNNAGHVRIADGTFVGSNSGGVFPTPGTFAGGNGVEVANCARVVFVHCTGRGGKGSYEACFYAPSGGRGGDGMRTQGSIVSIHGGAFRGGDGGYGDSYGGVGGSGLQAMNEKFLAAGASFQGGNGGGSNSPRCSFAAGSGGDGIFAFGGPSKTLGITALGGQPGTPGQYANPGLPGQPIAGGATIVAYPGSARTLSAARIVRDGSVTALTISGVPGEIVALEASLLSLFVFVPPYLGTWLVGAPSFYSHSAYVGEVGPAGNATLPFATRSLSGSAAAIRTTLQCLLHVPGVATLSDPALQVLIDSAALPDCNANSVNDFLDVVEGASPDVNQNLVPDECEQLGPSWFVDDSAAPGGTGSALAPFQSLDRAFQVALDGHTVHVADGLYVGPVNKDLNFSGRNFTVRSLNGPANCVIDCQGIGRVFTFNSGETHAAVVDGFTIANAAGSYEGGAVLIYNPTFTLFSSPTILNCTFTDCTTGQDGGAIYGFNSDVHVIDCTFIGNHTPLAGSGGNGGGAIYLAAGRPRVVGCTFELNHADRSGGGILVQTGYVAPAIISHCVFRQNSGNGGAIKVWGLGPMPALISNSLFVGNSGAAIEGEFGFAEVTSCSFTANTGSTAGAINLRSTEGSGWTLSNSILWGNGASQIHLRFSSVQLAVSYCDIKDGLSAVTGPGNLAWGNGNIDANPQFLDPDLRIGRASPCIDAGDNTRVPPDTLDLDGDGNTSEPTPFDLGYLRRFVDLPTPDTGNGAPPLVDMGCHERQVP